MNYSDTLPQLLELRAIESPEQAAYWVRKDDQWSPISWQVFFNKVQTVSYNLSQLGFMHGDVIAIMANTGFEWELFHHAILAIGGVVVGLDPNELPEQLNSMVNIADVKGLIVDKPERLNKFSNQTGQIFTKIITFNTSEVTTQWPQVIHIDTLISQQHTPHKSSVVNASDIATIVFTSGTTGAPKAVVYRHQQIVFAVNTILTTYPALKEQCHLACWLPLANLFQRIVNLSAVASGAQTYIVENPKQIIEYLPQINPHIFIAVPRFYEKLYQGLESKLDTVPVLLKRLINLSLLQAEKKSFTGIICKQLNYLFFKPFRSLFGCNIRYMVSGSAPMPVWLLKRFQAMGLLVLEAYGQSENVIPIAANRFDHYLLGSVGQVLPGNEIKLTEDKELLIKGMGVTSGYLGGKQSILDDDGFLATGDFAEIDSDGFVYLTGRKSEVFKTSTGRKIAPAFIESILQKITQVEHVVVYGQNKKFLIALITVNDFDSRSQHNLTDYAEQLIQQTPAYINDLPHYQQPVGIVLLGKSFSIAEQEITMNLKLRRKNIEQRYLQCINHLYSELENPQSAIHQQPISLDESTILLKL